MELKFFIKKSNLNRLYFLSNYIHFCAVIQLDQTNFLINVITKGILQMFLKIRVEGAVQLEPWIRHFSKQFNRLCHL